MIHVLLVPRGWIIICSFLVGLLLTVMPLPDWLVAARPEWLAMFVIYWTLALPTLVGITTAWCLGLLLDVLRDGLLGQHALTFVMISFLCIRFHQRIRLYPLQQQAFIVLILILLEQLVLLWINGFSGQPPTTWVYWLPAFTSALLWPFFFIIMREIGGRVRSH